MKALTLHHPCSQMIEVTRDVEGDDKSGEAAVRFAHGYTDGRPVLDDGSYWMPSRWFI